MNRIYSGRVLALEIENENGEFEQSDLDLLMPFHEVFQDCVNYYSIRLLSLATDPKSPFYKLRSQIEESVWDNFWRKGEERAGLKHSLFRVLQIPPEAQKALRFTDILDLFGKDYDKTAISGVSPDQIAGLTQAVLDEVIEFCRDDSGIQQKGKEMLPRLCDPKFGGGFEYDAASFSRAVGEYRLRSEFQEITDSEIGRYAGEAKLSWVVNVNEEKPFTGDEAKRRLREAVQYFSEFRKSDPEQIKSNGEKEVHALFQTRAWEKWLDGLDDQIENLSSEISIPRNRKGVLTRIFGMMLFQFFPSEITKTILALQFPPKKNQTEPENDSPYDFEDDPIKIARSPNGIVFPPFTSLPIWKDVVKNRKLPSQWNWKLFDLAGFSAALTTFNQIRLVEDKRETERVSANADALALLHGRGTSDEVEESEADGGLQGHPCLESFRELISRLKVSPTSGLDELGLFVSEPGDEPDPLPDRVTFPEELRGAGWILPPRSMKGFRDLSRIWNAIIKPGDGPSDSRVSSLKNALQNYRKENPETVGWAVLFSCLAEPEFWDVWRDSPDGSVNSFLKKYAKLSGLRVQMEKLLKPVQFTPADALQSRRLMWMGDLAGGISPAPKDSKKRGPRFYHELSNDPEGSRMGVKVPMAVRTANGWEAKRARLIYAAPRMLRDGLRDPSSDRAGLGAQNFTQPMWDALLGEAAVEDLAPEQKQDFSKCNFQLMPDQFQRGGEREIRYLLNFSAALEFEPMRQILKDRLDWNPQKWDSQFVSYDDEKFYLRWPDFDKTDKLTAPWYESAEDFHVLSVDLGVRFAAAYSVFCITTQKPEGKRPYRLIGETPLGKRYAVFARRGIIRVPGEGQKLPTREDSKKKNGEFLCLIPKAEEVENANALLTQLWLNPADYRLKYSDKEGSGFLSKGRCGDSLTRAVRHAKQHLNFLNSLMRDLKDNENEISWKQIGEDVDAKRPREKDEKKQPSSEWQQFLADLDEALKLEQPSRSSILSLVENCAEHHVGVLREGLEFLAQWILPQQRREWQWAEKEISSQEVPVWQLETRPLDAGILRKRTNATTPRVRGQGGISAARIRQIEDFRRECQGINVAFRRFRAITSEQTLVETYSRGEEADHIPDPCPTVLKKIEGLREQRVNQISHFILAEALGVKLLAPDKDTSSPWHHGEYRSTHPPVDFVVIENLSRYRTTQGRSRRENNQLMQWSHRSITAKMKELCAPFALSICEAPAPYSSRYCAISGMPGFRLQEVSSINPEWGPAKWASHRKCLAALLDTINRDRGSGKKRTLLQPSVGGELFLPADFEAGNPTNADINAAQNLGMRAVAAPDEFSIHHRARCDASTDGVVTLETRKRFGAKGGSVVLTEAQKEAIRSGRKMNFFHDPQPISDETDSVRIEWTDPKGNPRTERFSSSAKLESKGVWKNVQDHEWKICWRVNLLRLQGWKEIDSDLIDDLKKWMGESDSV